MAELRIENPPPINPDILHAQLTAALPDASNGFATDSRGLRLIFTRDLTDDEQVTAQAIIAAHEPAALTAAQAERAALDATETSERSRAAQAYAALDATQADLTTGWAAKTAAQKADALRDGLLLLLRMGRWLMARELRRG